ncbi:AsmA-like C-terminal region-containing protein [Alistipes communis]|uniref:AsmA family protein n=1 Tax=Alistipes communis TaxID=2585118 RepID=UPI001899DF2E|nr:AsmA-like C-terminal region-containing protein [Alistipes communis]
MKKFLKIVAIVAVVLIAVALVVPLALKSKVGDIVKKEAGELLTAEVDFRSLDLSLLRHFPHASVELEGLTVVCAAPFEGDTLASVGRISVVVDLMSLFGDSGYEVTKLLVDKAHLHARKLADGSVNWDVMKPSDEPAEEKEPAEADEPSAFRLRMRDVRLSEAVVRYEDDSTGMCAGVDPLDLRLSGDLSGERSDLDLRLEAHRLSYAAGGVALLRDADLTADVTLDADLKNKRFTFSDNRLSLNAIALSLDGWVALADDRTEMDVRVNSSKVEFRDVLSLVPAFYTRDFENLTASGQLTLDAWAKGVLAGDRLPAFETTLAVRDGSFKYASLPKAVTGITIDARAANPGGTADATTVDVPTFALTMAGNALRGSFSAATPMSDLRFKAAAAGKVDLGAVKEVYPLGDSIALAGVVTADMQASGRMSDIERERYEAIAASGRLTVEGVTAALAGLPEVKVRRAAMSVSPAALTLSELGVTVGRSDIEASGTLSNYIGYLLRDQTLRGRLDVRSSLLDLNELLGDASEASADTGAATAPADTAAMRAVVVPQNLDLALGASLKKILFQKMVLDDFTGSLTVAKGTVSMNRLAMNAFGGRMSASGSYSTAADAQRPALKLKAEIADASFSTTFDQLDVVRRMVPLFEKTGGDYSMSLDLATRLTQTMDPDYATLQADGAIRSKNIRVQNIAVFDQLAAALKNDALRRIEAKDVDIRFTIRDGRIATQPFDLRVGGISLNLSGSTGLDQTIDYTARVTLPEGSAGGILTAVDVGIGGSFSSPKITLDVKNAVKDAVSNAIGEKLGLSVGSSEGKSADEIRADAKAKGDKLVEEARAQRDKLVGKASGKLARIAAQASGDALVSAAEKQAQKLMEQAEQQIAAQQQ